MPSVRSQHKPVALLNKVVIASVQEPHSSTAFESPVSRRKVRVVHLVFSLEPGGMEHGVVKLVNAFDTSRVRASVCSTTPGGELLPQVASHVSVHHCRRRPGHDARLVRDLFVHFRRTRPDIVHTHGWGTLLEGMVAARAARVPYIVHGEHGTLQLKGYQRRLQRLGWSAADQVLSVSHRLAERMSRETGFPLARIQTIPNGVNLTRFSSVGRSVARTILGIASDAPTVVTIGRLVPVKNQRMLIEAVHLLRERDVNLTLLIAGDGVLKEELSNWIRECRLEDQVRLLGHRSDVEVVLAAADIFALPSNSEGMSLRRSRRGGTSI